MKNTEPVAEEPVNVSAQDRLETWSLDGHHGYEVGDAFGIHVPETKTTTVFRITRLRGDRQVDCLRATASGGRVSEWQQTNNVSIRQRFSMGLVWAGKDDLTPAETIQKVLEEQQKLKVPHRVDLQVGDILAWAFDPRQLMAVRRIGRSTDLLFTSTADKWIETKTPFRPLTLVRARQLLVIGNFPLVTSARGNLRPEPEPAQLHEIAERAREQVLGEGPLYTPDKYSDWIDAERRARGLHLVQAQTPSSAIRRRPPSTPIGTTRGYFSPLPKTLSDIALRLTIDPSMSSAERMFIPVGMTPDSRYVAAVVVHTNGDRATGVDWEAPVIFVPREKLEGNNHDRLGIVDHTFTIGSALPAGIAEATAGLCADLREGSADGLTVRELWTHGGGGASMRPERPGAALQTERSLEDVALEIA